VTIIDQALEGIAMGKTSYAQQMLSRIENTRDGSAFIVSDFTDIMDYSTAKRTLTRLAERGSVRRVIRGVYDKPRYSTLLEEQSAPIVEEIAYALARNYNWTIAPSGAAALNLLGLSTQVPGKWKFISSGPYKTYTFGKVTIEFLHRANREIAGMSKMTALVIQALKAIGKNNLDENTVEKLKLRLTEEDKARLLTEARQTTAWIYAVIKELCT
jgi:hypothetical protein